MKVVALPFLTVSKHPVHYLPSLISPRAMLELALPRRVLINNFHNFYIVKIVCWIALKELRHVHCFICEYIE